MKGYKIRGKTSEKIFRRKRLFRQIHNKSLVKKTTFPLSTTIRSLSWLTDVKPPSFGLPAPLPGFFQDVSVPSAAQEPAHTDLPPVFVPVLKLELNPILSCSVTTEVVES